MNAYFGLPASLLSLEKTLYHLTALFTFLPNALRFLQGDRILCTPEIREAPYSLSFGRYLSADPSGSPL